MRKRTELEYKSFPKKESWIVRTFQWDSLIVHGVSERMKQKSVASRRRMRDNGKRFIHWLKSILLEMCVNKEVPKGYKLNALCVYMNQKNIEFLHLNLDTYLWLDLAPKCCDELADDKYAIDPDEVIMMEEWPEIVSGE